MAALQDRGVVAVGAAAVAVPVVLAGIIIVVLVRETVTCSPAGMAVNAVGINVNSPNQPVWRGLAAMTFDT